MEWNKNDETNSECCSISPPNSHPDNIRTITSKSDTITAAPIPPNSVATTPTKLIDSPKIIVSNVLCANQLPSLVGNQDLLSDGELSDFSLNDSDEDDYKSTQTNLTGKLKLLLFK